MKKIYLLVLFLGGLYYAYEQSQVLPSAERGAEQVESTGPAWGPGDSDRQVQGSGRVSRILSDDNDGSRHQRFILTLASGQTLLVAHNIDLAPRIQSLQIGDTVSFHGEYEWNDKGGVIHWTHHDPQKQHVGGWLEHVGQRYE